MNQQQTWNFFQQMFFAQQQQQMMMQQFQAYNQFCQMNGLVPTDQNSFILFCHQNNNINPPNPPNLQIPISNVSDNSFLRINQNLNNKNVYINDGGIYISNNLEELIPRKEETLYMNEQMKNKPNTINIYFASSTGYNLMMVASIFTTFEQLFKDYMNRLSLPHYHIGVNIQFTINGRMLNPKSNVQIGAILKNNDRIEVLDIGNVQGAQ